MPDLFTQIALTLELALILTGVGLFWRHWASPSARAANRARPDALGRWAINGGDFMLFLWLVICVGLLAQFATAPALRDSGWSETATIVLTGGAFHLGMLLGALIFLLVFARRIAPAAPSPVRTGWLKPSLATFLIALPVLTATGLLWQWLLTGLGIELERQDLIGMFLETKSVALLTTMILLATLLAPITEEVVFRAGLFRYARHRIPRWVALLVPSLLFAALHANLASFAPLTVLGVIFALAYERTGRIAVPIVAHGLFNLNTLVLIFAGVGI
jgi:membrane protease YdiL (CAAX protease family)